MNTGPLYHWSPQTRFSLINENGLLVGQEPVTHTEKYGYLCFAHDPERAWRLSAAIIIEEDTSCGLGPRFPKWDLWQVTIAEEDEVHPLPYWGPNQGEIRIHNDIPRDRIWHVGTRNWDDHG